MKASLDLHDFSALNNRMELLFRLKEHFPGFKVSLFTVPNDMKSDWGFYLLREKSLKIIRENLDWMQLIPHGLTHAGSEMRNCDYNTFKLKVMPKIKQAFDRDGLPFVKGFCAPHWKWSQGVVKALDEAGWWGAIDKNQPNLISTKKVYRYSHNINEPLKGDVLKLHGHVYGTKNDLGDCFGNLLSLPTTMDWHFITDFIE